MTFEWVAQLLDACWGLCAGLAAYIVVLVASGFAEGYAAYALLSFLRRLLRRRAASSQAVPAFRVVALQPALTGLSLRWLPLSQFDKATQTSA